MMATAQNIVWAEMVKCRQMRNTKKISVIIWKPDTGISIHLIVDSQIYCNLFKVSPASCFTMTQRCRKRNTALLMPDPTVCMMLSSPIYFNLVIISFSFISISLVLQVKYEDRAIFHSFFRLLTVYYTVCYCLYSRCYRWFCVAHRNTVTQPVCSRTCCYIRSDVYCVYVFFPSLFLVVV